MKRGRSRASRVIQSDGTILWGAKDVLKYLRERWNWHIHRQWLHKVSTRKKDPFPMRSVLTARRARVTASTAQIDSWVARNRVRPSSATL